MVLLSSHVLYFNQHQGPHRIHVHISGSAGLKWKLWSLLTHCHGGSLSWSSFSLPINGRKQDPRPCFFLTLVISPCWGGLSFSSHSFEGFALIHWAGAQLIWHFWSRSRYQRGKKFQYLTLANVDKFFTVIPQMGQLNIYNDTCNEENIFHGLIMNDYNLKWKQCNKTDTGNWKFSIKDPKCDLTLMILIISKLVLIIFAKTT